MGLKQIVRFDVIDGHNIVRFIGDMTVDPAATMEAVEAGAAVLPIMEQIKAVNLKIKAQMEKAARLDEESMASSKNGSLVEDLKRAEAARLECQAALAQIPVIEAELEPLIKKLEAEKSELFYEKAVYFDPLPNEKILSPAEAADLAAKVAAISPPETEGQEGKPEKSKVREALTLEGEIIPDWRGTEYWRKDGGVWVKEKIEKIGESLPDGVVLPENLTPEIQGEMVEQQEAERIAGMTAKQKVKALEEALVAAGEEADRLDRVNHIRGLVFDPVSWYQKRKTEIEAKYA